MLFSITWTYWPNEEACYRAFQWEDGTDYEDAERSTKKDNAQRRRNCKARGVECHEDVLVYVGY